MKGSAWPQTFAKFEELPFELRTEIIRIAVKEAVSDRVSENIERYDQAARGELQSLYDFKAGVCPYSLGDGKCSDTASEAWYPKRRCEVRQGGRGPRVKLHAEVGYKHRVWGREERRFEVLRRWEVLGVLGGVLGTCKVFREEAIRWLEVRRVRGWSWDQGMDVRNGNGQVIRRGGEEKQASGKRKDVKMWLASVYRFPRLYSRETARIVVLD